MISRAASPIACAPVEQAVTTAWFGPFSPWRMDIWPEIRLMMLAGTKNGLMRRGPRSFRMIAFSAMPSSPPMPEPIRTPVAQRSASDFGSQPEVLQRFVRGRDAIDDEVADLAQFLRLEHGLGIEGAIRAVAARHGMRDLGSVIRDVELGDARAGGAPAQELAPTVLDANAQRRDEAHAGDDNAPHRWCPWTAGNAAMLRPKPCRCTSPRRRRSGWFRRRRRGSRPRIPLRTP